MFQTENLQEKWSPVLAHPDLPKIDDAYKGNSNYCNS